MTLLQPDGSSNLVAALERAKTHSETFQSAHPTRGKAHVLVVTDGPSNCEPGEPGDQAKTVAAQLAAAGNLVWIVAVAPQQDFDKTQLAGLATAGGAPNCQGASTCASGSLHQALAAADVTTAVRWILDKILADAGCVM